mmetsp:Transcript_13802/g.20953  ORF Transcript_13802/g.20953 Transcript_13802/m.20953 type:complete len:852 (-) Transcript_13802:1842-4397(-)|eukprot:CAMPEP_0203685852 /NCGR_PEP_ID=MMETSP0090-20130426/48762_1 /ASSEMBLY_ACC=CAM_ASM_001088 /TAXON_ID=426623 /ORGANISM="Chaetoceros affinis, Strain CCMP159" /LENGTH=851 /DNA_ID=CAMNT_0050555063 /DNA_START=35 /DNA_END=2590 /DNA_ORIENTATION=+
MNYGKPESEIIVNEQMLDVHPIPASTIKSNITTRSNGDNFNDLKLVDKPDSPMNARGDETSFSLRNCLGYLRRLPLKAPNSSLQNPQTIVNMVNILTDPTATAEFAKEEEHNEQREEGEPDSVFEPTSELMKKKLKEIKKKTSHIKAPSVLGRVVEPGNICFYKKDGLTFAVTEGRWLLRSVKARWIGKSMSLDRDKILLQDSKVLIVRVKPGEVALAREQGVEVILDVGTHVFNSGTVILEGRVKFATTAHFSHGRYHYLRVSRGHFGKVWVETMSSSGARTLVPRLLDEGEHYIDSHLFKFEGFVKCSIDIIEHGSIHLISVPKGKVAKVFQETKPRLLGEGDHFIESTDFEFHGWEDIILNNVIVHGTITILRVTLGKIALAWKDSDPVFISDPGLYEFDSANFSFVEFKDAEERLIQLGAKKIILVHTGQVGVSYDDGLLKILPNGRHIISSSTHIFHRFLSTQQKSIRLATLNANERISRKNMKKLQASKYAQEDSFFGSNGEDSDLTICETKDLVKVGLRADVFYSIEDPEKCINKIDTDELEDLVRETAIATLTNIIRSTALNQIAQSNNVSVGSDGSDLLTNLQSNDQGIENPAPSAPMAVFFEKAHDEFMVKLHDDFMQRYGVDIANIRIESFKIMDNDLAESISKHALTTAQIENEMANLEGKSLISTQTERTSAEVKNISAQADASALKTTADAENQRKIDAARAIAESLKINAKAEAEAEAEAILMKAKAEAEAIALKARAEAERAAMLSRTELGQQEALLNIYSDMVVKSNQGVEKVVYLDPSVSRESPFALSGLHNLNQDLHSLTQIGIAANETQVENRADRQSKFEKINVHNKQKV